MLYRNVGWTLSISIISKYLNEIIREILFQRPIYYFCVSVSFAKPFNTPNAPPVHRSHTKYFSNPFDSDIMAFYISFFFLFVGQSSSMTERHEIQQSRTILSCIHRNAFALMPGEIEQRIIIVWMCFNHNYGRSPKFEHTHRWTFGWLLAGNCDEDHSPRPGWWRKNRRLSAVFNQPIVEFKLSVQLHWWFFVVWIIRCRWTGGVICGMDVVRIE